jgi:hypothetical protein
MDMLVRRVSVVLGRGEHRDAKVVIKATTILSTARAVRTSRARGGVRNMLKAQVTARRKRMIGFEVRRQGGQCWLDGRAEKSWRRDESH